MWKSGSSLRIAAKMRYPPRDSSAPSAGRRGFGPDERDVAGPDARRAQVPRDGRAGARAAASAGIAAPSGQEGFLPADRISVDTACPCGEPPAGTYRPYDPAMPMSPVLLLVGLVLALALLVLEVWIGYLIV